MYVAWIHDTVYTDGPGARASIAVQGCSIRCPGCQVPETWKHRTGSAMSPQEAADRLLATGLPITIMGGEPFDQPDDVSELVGLLKDYGRHVIVYTGNTLEDLERRTRERRPDSRAIQMILARIDVLVDGPFIASQDNGRLAYRGSANQRPIDMETWRETGEIALLDWDAGDELTILPDGSIIGPVDVVTELAGLLETTSVPTRRCGQAPQAS